MSVLKLFDAILWVAYTQPRAQPRPRTPTREAVGLRADGQFTGAPPTSSSSPNARNRGSLISLESTPERAPACPNCVENPASSADQPITTSQCDKLTLERHGDRMAPSLSATLSPRTLRIKLRITDLEGQRREAAIAVVEITLEVAPMPLCPHPPIGAEENPPPSVELRLCLHL
jgi:hypothetical protein